MTVGIILGGVHIWRPTSWEAVCPPLLLPVANAPLVSSILDWLKTGGISTAVLCVNESAERVRELVSDGSAWGMDATYYVDRVPRGPAGCCRDAADLVPAEDYVVVEGSLIPAVDLVELRAAHRRAEAAITVVVAAGAEEESEPGDVKPAGMYVLSRAALAGIGKTSYQDLKESLVRRVAAEGGPVLAHVVQSAGQRVRELPEYLTAQEVALRTAWEHGVAPVGYRWQGQSCVHRSARVAAESRLVGWVMVGARCGIAPGAVLVGPTVLGDDCSVGEGSAVSRCVLWEQAGVGRAARVDLSVCTNGSFVPDGAWVYSECRIGGPRARVVARA